MVNHQPIFAEYFQSNIVRVAVEVTYTLLCAFFANIWINVRIFSFQGDWDPQFLFQWFCSNII